MVDVEIWTEKYRPKRVDDIVGNENAKILVKSFLESPEMFPQLMMFVGEPGTGKTSMANAIAHTLYKGNMFNFKEFNASDDRGINFIRTEIKKIATSGIYGNAPFRIIFLDEADYLTPEAQAILRRITEKYSKATRFIFSINYPNRIIKPLISRATIIHFSKPSKEELLAFIEKIANLENFAIEETAAENLIALSDYIPRNVLVKLQACYVIAKHENPDDPVISTHIVNMTGSPMSAASISLAPVIRAIKYKNLYEAVKAIDDLLGMGVSPLYLLSNLLEKVIGSQNFTDKYEVLKAFSKVDKALNHGGTPLIQFAYLLGVMIEHYNPPSNRA